MLICPPALIYLIFCIVQIILDSINGLYNTALVKTFVAIIITFLLVHHLKYTLFLIVIVEGLNTEKLI